MTALWGVCRMLTSADLSRLTSYDVVISETKLTIKCCAYASCSGHVR